MGKDIRSVHPPFHAIQSIASSLLLTILHESGNICTVKALGKQIVILNCPQLAHDMLMKKASIYSDRFDMLNNYSFITLI